ncbi:MAG TPA: LysM peptidoglycan-binding domain-containing protein [Minicystis sp.]|nr:LysM peptidoglycan-binding domain-containing protein [Minicystis sp.]
MKARTLRLTLSTALAPVVAILAPGDALAQDAAAPGGAPVVTVQPSGGGEQGAGGPAVTVVQLPAAPAQQQTVYGPLPPAGFDPNAHLPSSSRAVTDINGPGDGFDLDPNAATAGGPSSVRGGANGSYQVEGGGGFVPELHTVRRGDTLWEISGKYFANPYQWPRIWAENPQIQNPHWIYPGDRVRLREAGPVGGGAVGAFRGRRRTVPPQTIFLRDQGWVDDKDGDDWGEVLGSPQDTMILSEGAAVYIQLREGHEMAIGELLTIWRPIRTVETENTKGELVSIRGTARIDRFNPRTHMVRAKVVEALDVIERGARVGPVGRRFDVVPPVPSDVDLEAHIIAAVYPYQFYGQNQVVYLDRGAKEGVKPGMRFFAVHRGDLWIEHLGTAGTMAKVRPRTEDNRPARIDPLRTTIDEDLLPDETYAEFRVVTTRDHTCMALVTASRHEIEHNARLVARRGL